MARIINSPGVQITETDLSLNSVIGGGTVVFVPGFASQGPTDETILVSSVSELEKIYGIPETPAERYFYHSCKELLNSPSTLLTTRLPYGSGSGDGFASQYSALLFPVASGSNEFSIGTPTHISFDENTYNDIMRGNFTWSGFAGTGGMSSIVTVNSSVTVPVTDYNTTLDAITAVDPTPDTYSAVFSGPNVTFTFQVTSLVTTPPTPTSASFTGGMMNAGIIVINKAQTTINENFEGYYVSITDNSEFGPASDFTAVKYATTLLNTSTFWQLPQSKLNFSLSATSLELGQNSVSEVIESVPTFDFGADFYKDSVIVNVFKIRNSIYEPQILDYSLAESFLGSLDSSKKTVDIGGGIAKSFFLEEVVNNSSSNIKVLVNPLLSRKTNWADPSSQNPISQVRGDTSESLKSLYPVGSWIPRYEAESNKENGNLVKKLERALSLVESTETTTLDIVVDAGLSTIFANGGTGYYDDSKFMGALTGPSDPRVLDWRAVFNVFNTFVQNIRKDCVFISDPLRQIFIDGPNSKSTAAKNSSFSTAIYTPLKDCYSNINSNYSVTYANWVKTYDAFTDKQVWLPISAYAAAIYCRTDFATQTWIAPAGLNRGTINNIIDLAFNPNQKQRDFLYTISLNPVVFFSGDGFVVFGQKTLQNKPSAFDRVNVRRLFLTLERAVGNTLKYFVFEPNTEFTRTRARNTIVPILELAKNTEGIYDYNIVLDERNNTPDVIDRNEMAVDIYLKPVRASEFILLNFIATRTGQNFQELI
jgi:hypothetical protein